jgi:type I restriction enzyme S subunit
VSGLKLQTVRLENQYEKRMLKLEELKKSLLQKAFSGQLTVKDAA